MNAWRIKLLVIMSSTLDFNASKVAITNKTIGDETITNLEKKVLVTTSYARANKQPLDILCDAIDQDQLQRTDEGIDLDTYLKTNHAQKYEKYIHSKLNSLLSCPPSLSYIDNIANMVEKVTGVLCGGDKHIFDRVLRRISDNQHTCSKYHSIINSIKEYLHSAGESTTILSSDARSARNAVLEACTYNEEVTTKEVCETLDICVKRTYGRICRKRKFCDFTAVHYSMNKRLKISEIKKQAIDVYTHSDDASYFPMKFGRVTVNFDDDRKPIIHPQRELVHAYVTRTYKDFKNSSIYQEYTLENK